MTTPFTRTDYALLPEGFPAELVQGRLVKEPAPTYGHQLLVSRLHVQLARLVGPERALMGPVDVALGELDVFQPDLVVLDDLPPAESREVGVPRLVVEVHSPSSRRRDRDVKAARYLAAGVAEVWLVDPAAGTVERRSAGGPARARGRERLPSVALPGFEVVPASLFAPPPA